MPVAGVGMSGAASEKLTNAEVRSRDMVVIGVLEGMVMPIDGLPPVTVEPSKK